MDKITFVIIHFNTQKLLRLCIKSLLECYQDANILIIDNGSKNKQYAESLSICNKNISCLFNPINLTHGPAMHQAIHLCTTDFVFFLDSDCIVKRPGFIEKMIQENGYATGKIQFVNKDGINIPDTVEDGIKYVHPSSMLIKRKHYFLLPPFKAHGAPCIDNMMQANYTDTILIDFPINDYISHIGRGTREGLGTSWDGKKKKQTKRWLSIRRIND